ncbi:MAG: DUF4249 family protein [Chitinophagales bacterium]|nr:DUF4249 family protein [Chitinophagales bacterium]
MKVVLYIVSILSVAIIISSCEKDVILDITPGAEDAVVEAWIYNNSGPLVMLSKQFSGYGTFNTATLTDELNVKNAVVLVSENNGSPIQLAQKSIFDLPIDLLEQVLDANRFPRAAAPAIALLSGFTLEQQLSFAQSTEDTALIRLLNNFNFYIDTSNTIIGQGGASYQLQISKEDIALFAETTMPISQGINFLSYTIADDNPNLAQVKMNLTVPNNYDAFVLLATSRNQDPFYIPDYLGGGLSDNGIYAGSGTITLPLLRGYGDNEDVEIADLGLFELGDTVTLKWQNIDEATYNFWFSVFNDGGDTPFSTATKIQSNVENGFGIWAAYNTTYTTIILD